MTDSLKTTERADLESALGILTACEQDLDEIEASIPQSKRSSKFSRAAASLRRRIEVGKEMREAMRR